MPPPRYQRKPRSDALYYERPPMFSGPGFHWQGPGWYAASALGVRKVG